MTSYLSHHDYAGASRKQLLWGTAGAAALAAVILITLVLPLEYGVDPTGLGRLAGFTRKASGKPQIALAKPGTHLAHSEKYRHDIVEITLKGDEALEYKAVLAAGEPLLYSWQVKGGKAYFDFHADPTEGKWPDGYAQRYQEGESDSGHGALIAPFTGNHGWYWFNLQGEPVTIVLEVSGYYSHLGRIEQTPSQIDPH